MAPLVQCVNTPVSKDCLQSIFSFFILLLNSLLRAPRTAAVVQLVILATAERVKESPVSSDCAREISVTHLPRAWR